MGENGEEIWEAIHPYVATSKEQLSLMLGDKLQVMEMNSSGWWIGKNEAGNVGLFPFTYARKVQRRQFNGPMEHKPLQFSGNGGAEHNDPNSSERAMADELGLDLDSDGDEDPASPVGSGPAQSTVGGNPGEVASLKTENAKLQKRFMQLQRRIEESEKFHQKTAMEVSEARRESERNKTQLSVVKRQYFQLRKSHRDLQLEYNDVIGEDGEAVEVLDIGDDVMEEEPPAPIAAPAPEAPKPTGEPEEPPSPPAEVEEKKDTEGAKAFSDHEEEPAAEGEEEKKKEKKKKEKKKAKDKGEEKAEEEAAPEAPTGPPPPVPIEPSEYDNLKVKYKKLAAKYKKQLAELEEVKATLESTEADKKLYGKKLKKAKTELATSKEELVASKETLDKTQQEAQEGAEEARKEALAKGAKELEEAKQALEEMKKDLQNSEELKRELKESQAQLTDTQDRLRKEEVERRKLHNEIQELKGNIRVFVRAKPITTEAEKEDSVAVTFGDAGLVQVADNRGNKHSFEFDYGFPGNSTQEAIYKEVKPLATSVIDGYNVCIFAYGQTGSGKTFTMDGPENCQDESLRGVNFRTVKELFLISETRKEWDIVIEVGVLEVYCDGVYDLLKNREQIEQVRMGSGKDSVIITQVKNQVRSVDDVMENLINARKFRKMTSTNMNADSSRSHCILTVFCSCKSKVDKRDYSAKLHLVDLAGSERINDSGVTGQALKEAQAINKSLSGLGNVISSLQKKSGHVPYRDHNLTKILSDSLGGNCKCMMFANVSQVKKNASETSSTLEFASRARKVELGKATVQGK